MLSPFQMSRYKLINHIWCSWKNHRLIFLFWLVHSFFYIVIPKQTSFQTFKYFMIEMDRCTSTFHRCSWLSNYNPHNHFRKFMKMQILFDPFKAVCFIFLSKKRIDTNRFYIAPHMQRNTFIYGCLLYSNQYLCTSVDCVSKQEDVLSSLFLSLSRSLLTLYIVSCFIHNTQWNT